jgi:hypothetical protein
LNEVSCPAGTANQNVLSATSPDVTSNAACGTITVFDTLLLGESARTSNVRLNFPTNIGAIKGVRLSSVNEDGVPIGSWKWRPEEGMAAAPCESDSSLERDAFLEMTFTGTEVPSFTFLQWEAPAELPGGLAHRPNDKPMVVVTVRAWISLDGTSWVPLVSKSGGATEAQIAYGAYDVGTNLFMPAGFSLSGTTLCQPLAEAPADSPNPVLAEIMANTDSTEEPEDLFVLPVVPSMAGEVTGGDGQWERDLLTPHSVRSHTFGCFNAAGDARPCTFMAASRIGQLISLELPNGGEAFPAAAGVAQDGCLSSTALLTQRSSDLSRFAIMASDSLMIKEPKSSSVEDRIASMLPNGVVEVAGYFGVGPGEPLTFQGSYGTITIKPLINKKMPKIKDPAFDELVKYFGTEVAREFMPYSPSLAPRAKVRFGVTVNWQFRDSGAQDTEAASSSSSATVAIVVLSVLLCLMCVLTVVLAGCLAFTRRNSMASSAAYSSVSHAAGSRPRSHSRLSHSSSTRRF